METPNGGNSVELLFGVQGGGSISGESGARIKEQINAIAREIEKDGTTHLRFSVDTSSTQNFKKDLQQINSITNNISNKPILTSKNFDYGSIAQYKNKINELMTSLQATNSGFDVSKLKVTGFANATDSGKIAFTLFNKELQETRTVVLNLGQNELKTCSTQELLNKTVQQGTVNYAAMQKEQQKAIKTSEQEANAKQRVANTHNSTLSAMMKYYRTNEVNLKSNKALYQEFLTLQSQMQSRGFFRTSAQAAGAWDAFKVKAQEAGVEVKSLGQQMKGLFQNRLGYMLAGYASMAVYSSIRQLYTNVVELDSALTQLQIVTGKSRQEIKAFGDDAANTAKKIGVSISDITSSTETYARLGYSLKDALNLSEITNSFSNIAAINIDDATSGMTAILKGYNLDASQAEHVADVLTEVGQKYAVSASEIAEALQNGGAALHTANTSFEKSVGLVASGNAAIKCLSHNTVMYYRKIA